MVGKTKLAHAREIIKCGKNPEYFFNTYCKVRHPMRGLVKFETYPFQNDCIKAFQEHDHNVILKARQLGLSTLTAAYATWMLLFRPNSSILVIATKLHVAKNFVKKCKLILQHVPKWMVLADITSNLTEIKTSRNSEIIAVPTSADAGRSEALSLLIVDEAAHIRDFDDHWDGLWPTLSTGGKSIILSTPYGTGNKFFELCQNAENADSDFNLTTLPWNVHPERDDEWFAKQTRAMPKKKIAQEHECAFNASGDTFLDSTVLARIQDDIRAPIERLGFDRNIWVWERPKKDSKYIISVDTARGDSKDYSAFHVIDQTIGEVVAEYKGKAPPDRLAEIVNDIGLKYNTALVCPENNNVGYATIQKLCDLKYPRIYNSKKKTLDLWSGFSKQGDLQRPSGDLGIFTSGQKRPVLLTKMEEVFRNKGLRTYSSRLHKELMTFVWLNANKVAAEKNRHDDLVMALAIGMWLYDASDYNLNAENYNTCLIEGITRDSASIDDIIDSTPHQPDNGVFLPVAGGSGGGFGQAKRPVAQALTKHWSWLLDK